MGPDLTKYKVVYNDRVLRALYLENVQYAMGSIQTPWTTTARAS